MLLQKRILDEIAAGRVTLVFRRWKRPTVKTGGQLRTRIGVLDIDAVDVIKESQITDRDAIQAGFASRQELLEELRRRTEGQLYRIKLRPGGEDPRVALRKKSKLTRPELEEIRLKLERMDERSGTGCWTNATLQLISEHPATRAPDLAAELGLEKKRFKTNVRKLKELGLTESLDVGYRLSPRGKAVWKRLNQS